MPATAATAAAEATEEEIKQELRAVQRKREKQAEWDAFSNAMGSLASLSVAAAAWWVYWELK